MTVKAGASTLVNMKPGTPMLIAEIASAAIRVSNAVKRPYWKIVADKGSARRNRPRVAGSASKRLPAAVHASTDGVPHSTSTETSPPVRAAFAQGQKS